MGDIVQLFSREHLRTRRAPAQLGADAWYQRGCDLEPTAPDAARRAYRRALAAAPHHRHAHINLGRLLHEAGDLGAAEGHYRLALSPAEPSPDATAPPGPEITALAWFNLGVVVEDTGRLAEARSAYQQALAAAPALADAHFNLALVLERLGDPMGALRHLSTYRRLTRKAG